MRQPEPDTGVLSQTPDSKQQQVYKLIRDAIVKNEFPPGTVMVERKLCDIYNVSRSPIRNALQQLTFEGLLTYWGPVRRLPVGPALPRFYRGPLQQPPPENPV